MTLEQINQLKIIMADYRYSPFFHSFANGANTVSSHSMSFLSSQLFSYFPTMKMQFVTPVIQ